MINGCDGNHCNTRVFGLIRGIRNPVVDDKSVMVDDILIIVDDFFLAFSRCILLRCVDMRKSKADNVYMLKKYVDKTVKKVDKPREIARHIARQEDCQMEFLTTERTRGPILYNVKFWLYFLYIYCRASFTHEVE